MSFFNPYMKGPDWGQGISDAVNQYINFLLLKKMFTPQQNNVPIQQVLPKSNNNIGQQLMAMAPQISNNQPFDYRQLLSMTPQVQGNQSLNLSQLLSLLSLIGL